MAQFPFRGSLKFWPATGQGDSPSATALVCPQGHGEGKRGEMFCASCGVRLIAAPAAAETNMARAGGSATPSVAAGATAPAALVSAPAAAAMTATASTAPLSALPSWLTSATPCGACGGNGEQLAAEEIVCSQCAWLRPLFPGYKLDRAVFLWAQDGQAMNKLRGIGPLNAVARSVSDKVGRPWIESTFNGIRLGPKQLPDVWRQAVLAARILGLPKMPDVYVAGDQMWNTYTFGSDTGSFIVLGTAILTNFQGDELLFMLAREMGHCCAGHSLWKTVTRFLAGDMGVHSSILSGGLLGALSPTKLIESAAAVPLMAWSRQSDVTADRAGLMAVGDEQLARRVLLAWSIRSARLLKDVNIEEWMKQEDASGDSITRFSEMATSASMYTTRRLRLLGQAARETELMRWSESVQPVRKQIAAGWRKSGTAGPAPIAKAPNSSAASADALRVTCQKCKETMRIPFAVLRGKDVLNTRCPQCGTVTTLRRKAASGMQAKQDAASPSAVNV